MDLLPLPLIARVLQEASEQEVRVLLRVQLVSRPLRQHARQVMGGPPPTRRARCRPGAQPSRCAATLLQVLQLLRYLDERNGSWLVKQRPCCTGARGLRALVRQCSGLRALTTNLPIRCT